MARQPRAIRTEMAAEHRAAEVAGTQALSLEERGDQSGADAAWAVAERHHARAEVLRAEYIAETGIDVSTDGTVHPEQELGESHSFELGSKHVLIAAGIDPTDMPVVEQARRAEVVRTEQAEAAKAQFDDDVRSFVGEALGVDVSELTMAEVADLVEANDDKINQAVYGEFEVADYEPIELEDAEGNTIIIDEMAPVRALLDADFALDIPEHLKDKVKVGDGTDPDAGSGGGPGGPADEPPPAGEEPTTGGQAGGSSGSGSPGGSGSAGGSSTPGSQPPPPQGDVPGSGAPPPPPAGGPSGTTEEPAPGSPAGGSESPAPGGSGGGSAPGSPAGGPESPAPGGSGPSGDPGTDTPAADPVTAAPDGSGGTTPGAGGPDAPPTPGGTPTDLPGTGVPGSSPGGSGASPMPDGAIVVDVVESTYFPETGENLPTVLIDAEGNLYHGDGTPFTQEETDAYTAWYEQESGGSLDDGSFTGEGWVEPKAGEGSGGEAGTGGAGAGSGGSESGATGGSGGQTGTAGGTDNSGSDDSGSDDGGSDGSGSDGGGSDEGGSDDTDTGDADTGTDGAEEGADDPPPNEDQAPPGEGNDAGTGRTIEDLFNDPHFQIKMWAERNSDITPDPMKDLAGAPAGEPDDGRDPGMPGPAPVVNPGEDYIPVREPDPAVLADVRFGRGDIDWGDDGPPPEPTEPPPPPMGGPHPSVAADLRFGGGAASAPGGAPTAGAPPAEAADSPQDPDASHADLAPAVIPLEEVGPADVAATEEVVAVDPVVPPVSEEPELAGGESEDHLDPD